MICNIALLLLTTTGALAGCHNGGHCRKSFDKWQASGTYTMRSWTSAESGHAEDAAMEAQMYRRYGFRKLYDSHLQMYRVDAYPLSPADGHEFPLIGVNHHKKHAPLGPFVFLSSKNEIWLIEERQAANGGVKCKRFEHRFRKHDPMKNAKYAGLSFEHNELSNHYTDLQLNESPRCQFSQSHLWLNSFTGRPVAMHLEGHCATRSLNEEQDLLRFQQHDSTGERHSRRSFLIDVVVNDFDTFIANEKEWFNLPHNVEQVCRHEDIMTPQSDDGQFLSAMDLLNS